MYKNKAVLSGVPKLSEMVISKGCKNAGVCLRETQQGIVIRPDLSSQIHIIWESDDKVSTA
jgi:hypothetical protein